MILALPDPAGIRVRFPSGQEDYIYSLGRRKPYRELTETPVFRVQRFYGVRFDEIRVVKKLEELRA